MKKLLLLGALLALAMQNVACTPFDNARPALPAASEGLVAESDLAGSAFDTDVDLNATETGGNPFSVDLRGLNGLSRVFQPSSLGEDVPDLFARLSEGTADGGTNDGATSDAEDAPASAATATPAPAPAPAPAPTPAPKATTVPVRPLAQNNSVSCGQTSVAMAINSIRGTNLQDYDINARYGFSLLGALNAESRGTGVSWRDAGDLSASKWPAIEGALDRGLPVVVALNGSEFSPSGRGHIVLVVGIDGDRVEFADPATGTIRRTSKRNMETAPRHPDGNFIFLPRRG